MIPDVTLNTGDSIPQLGFGTFRIAPDQAAWAVGEALDLGYRHIDTAQMYGNEAGVGEALNASGIARHEVFVTTKLNNNNHRPDDARRSFEASLKALGTDYVDLFLIHWPMPTAYGGDFVSTWRVLDEFARDGRARAIGVSNFHSAHIQQLLDETGLCPAVNQIEAHPYLPNRALVAHCHGLGIVVEAWPPVARGALLEEPLVVGIAESLGRTPAQIVLRWHIQRGHVVFPKTVTPARMRENLGLFDFELSGEQTSAIDSLNRGRDGRIGPDPETFGWMPS